RRGLTVPRKLRSRPAGPPLSRRLRVTGMAAMSLHTQRRSGTVDVFRMKAPPLLNPPIDAFAFAKKPAGVSTGFFLSRTRAPTQGCHQPKTPCPPFLVI